MNKLFVHNRHSWLSGALALIIAIVLLSAEALAADTKNAESQVVAEVGQRRITLLDVNSELSRQLRETLTYFDEPQLHYLRTQMLNKIIDRELLFRAALAKSLNPDNESVSAVIDQLRSNLGSDEAFQQALADNGVTEAEFRTGIAQDLAIKAYLEQLVFADIKIDDRDLEAFYNKDPQTFSDPPEVKARHILIKTPERPDTEQLGNARRRAEQIREQALRADADFSELAKKHSEGPTRQRGGELGFFTRNQMIPAFADAAFALQPGEVSDVVQTRYGFHVIKVEEKRGGQSHAFAEVKDKVRAAMLQEKRDRALAIELERLRNATKVIVYLN